jgi:hypothetical protein
MGGRLGRTAWLALAASTLAALPACQGEVSPTTEPPGSPSALPETEAVEVWAVGDGTTESEESQQVAKLIAAADPDRVLYLGDVYDDYSDRMDATFGAVDLLDAMLPTAGNHEWPEQRDEYLEYWRDVRGEPLGPFYATRMAGWQVVSINTEEPVEPGSAQLRWLRRTVAGDGTCRLAIMHRPRWSAGRHGDQEDMAPVWRALAGRTTLVLSGHDHDMQRFAPRNGITQLVSGAGGRGLYDVDESDRRLRFSNDTEFGALRLTLAPGEATYAFVTVDGEELDSGQVTCEAG